MQKTLIALGAVIAVVLVGAGIVVAVGGSAPSLPGLRAAKATLASSSTPRSTGTSAATTRPSAAATTIPARPAPAGPPPAQTPIVYRVTTTDPVVFFTIDDGWDADPRVLSMLRDQQIPMTTFLLGAA